MRYLLHHRGAAVPLSSASFVIGRDPDCDLCVSDPAVSRRHARVAAAPAGIWLEDLGSRNGTYVEGRRIREPVRLGRGGGFRLGGETFVVVARWTAGATGIHVPARIDEIQTQGSGPDLSTWTHANDAADPVQAVSSSFDAILGDSSLSFPDRFHACLRHVDVLHGLQLDDAARRLLGRLLDLLVDRPERAALPPMVVMDAQSLLARWWVHLNEEPAWRSRSEALLEAVRA